MDQTACDAGPLTLVDRGPVPLGSGFPSRIRRLRKSKGWSQCELARRAGISNAFLSRVETGRQGCSLVVADRLAGTLGTTREALFGVSRDEVAAVAVTRMIEELQEQLGTLQADLVAAQRALTRIAAAQGIDQAQPVGRPLRLSME